MAINTISKFITLDVYNHNTTPETVKTIKAIAADNDTRYVAAEIQNEGVWYDIGSDSDVELIILRPDKVGVQITGQPYPFTYQSGGEIDPETGDETPVVTETYYGVYAELDQPALAKSGTLLGQFKITSGEQVLRTEIFKINNGRALDTETDEWAGEYQGYNLDELAAAIDENADDIAVIESDVSQIKEDLNDLMGSNVNYDYDTPYHSEPIPSGSAYQAIGVARNLTNVVLNGTVPSGENIRVKLSGEVSRVSTGTSVEAWSGIELVEGHSYAVKCKHIGGTMSAIYVSVYKEGTHNTIGEYTDDGVTFVRTFIADSSKYIIALYLASNNSYTDAEYIVTLVDVTASRIEALEGGLADVSEFQSELNLLYTASGMSGLFDQGGYNRSGTRLSSSSYVASTIFTPDFLSDDLIKMEVGGAYKFALSAFNANGTWAGFLVDDYVFSTVPTDTWYLTQKLLVAKYREMYPTLNFRVQLSNTSGNLVPILPEEASNITAYYNSEKYDGIESYYKTEMDNTLASVRASLTEPALVFPLVTDIHYQSVNDSFDDCADNMKYLTSKIRCDFVLNLGDDTDGNVAQELTLARAYHMKERFAEIDLPYYHAIGNHDTNYYQSAPVFNSDQIFSAYLSNTRGVHFDLTAGEKNFYKDFDELGIRLIVLDGNHGGSYRFSANTATWLENTALDTSYIVVIGVHFSPIKEQNWSARSMSNATAVAAAIQNFVNNGGTVIQLCGHSHADYHFDTPWLSIHNNCQKFIQEDSTDSGYADIASAVNDLEFPARTAGTATEDCWSVVIIKPISRKIDLIRFGAGNDREFSF